MSDGTVPACVLWRRLDTPGHDACRLDGRDGRFAIEGTALFLHDARPARLDYQVSSDRGWRTQRGRVSGWLHFQRIDFDVIRTAEGVWTLNGREVGGLESCLDLDLAFTPATNLLQLRRLSLAPGEAADAPVAWLDVAGTLSLLPQRYERHDEATYWYEAPTVGYAGLLEVLPTGFIRRYPGLWEMEG